jgi:AcrR family transcriptional regulator
MRTRARLLEAAKRVFEEHGFLDARISDITKRARLSHGSFYNYFDSKEEIFREMAGSLQERFGMHSMLVPGRLHSLPGPHMRDWFVESHRRFFEEYRKEARIMGLIEQVSRYDDQVRATRLATEKLYYQRAEAAIRALQREGAVDKRLDPTVATHALSALITRFAEMWFVEGQVHCKMEHGLEQITTLCMNALSLKMPPDKP